MADEKKRPQILLPIGKLISQFAEEIGEILKETNKIFYRTDIQEIVEIGEIKHQQIENGKKIEKEFKGFKIITPYRFITLTEKFIETQGFTKKDGIITKSMSSELARIVLLSSQFINKMPKIERIYTCPIPMIYENKLTFPKKGFDERFKSWLIEESPEITENVTIEEAKKIIDNIFEEFCFRDINKDKTNAIAGLITPFLRGLYEYQTARTPLIVYEANRERCGKDYCANITGLVYEGFKIEDSLGDSEETRKKITSALLTGRKRVHFSNAKGYINNDSFERILTASDWNDRILGKSIETTLKNEIDFSLSGNLGLEMENDLRLRSLFVRLFLAIENPNERDFKTTNLHEQILKKRDLILSSLYALVKNWFDSDKKTTFRFASFPEWANICGGILEKAGYGIPFADSKDIDSVGISSELRDMKELFTMCKDKTFNGNEIHKIINEQQLFNYLDKNTKSGETKLGITLQKYIGRILSNIIMESNDPKLRFSRQIITFKEIVNLNSS